MNVIALRQEPVFSYPVSRVMNPVVLRRLEMSMAFSPSVPRTTGSSYSFPSRVRSAVSGFLGWSLRASAIFHLVSVWRWKQPKKSTAQGAGTRSRDAPLAREDLQRRFHLRIGACIE